MARQAEVKVKVTSEGVDVVDQQLDDLEKKAQSLFSRLPKEVQKGLMEGYRKTGEALRSAVTNSAISAGMAITGPARTTFDQALRAANDFRRDTAKISVSSGKDFGMVQAQVKLVSRAIGEMPETTMGWARSMRKLTGDFDGAINVMGAVKDRALQLDEPIEALLDQSAMLANNFGIKSTDQMDKFFGTMDAQAKRAGVSVQMLSRNFNQFAGEFSRMSGKGPAGFSALTAAFMGSEKNPDQAARNQAFGMSTLSQGVRLVEMRMRNAGKKGFSITNPETGEVDVPKYLEAMKFMQRDMLRFYGGSKRRAIEVQAGEDIGARRAVGGFLNTDFSNMKAEDIDQLPVEVRGAAQKYFGLTNNRDRREAGKNIADQEAGDVLLPGQDAAISAGGGAAGLAMEAATTAFGTAVDRFGNAVMTFIGRGGGFSAGAGGGGAATAAAGAAAGTAGGILGKAVPVLGAGMLGYQVGTMADEALGMSDWISDKIASLTLGPDYVSPSDSAGAPSAIPREVALSPSAARAQGEAQANALQNKVLKVQIVPSIGPPPPESAAK